MPTVLVTGPTITQNSLFSSLAITITSTHFAYPRRDDQAELAWVAWLNSKSARLYSREWSVLRHQYLTLFYKVLKVN